MQERDIVYRSADGLELYAKQWGPDDASQTVLCLHGLTRNHKDFAPMVHALGGDRRYIAWDTRGRGASQRDSDPTNYRNDIYARDVVTLLDHVGVDRCALVGTSMGGLISMILMNTTPERITGVVLNDIGPKLEQVGLDRIAGYVGQIKVFDSFEAAGQAVKASQSMAFPDYGDDDWTAFAKRTFVQTERGLELDYDPAIADSLKYIKVDEETVQIAWQLFAAMRKRPMLIVRGGLSDLFSAQTTAEMIEHHGNASEVVAENIGHAPILDEPNVASAIDKFLNSLETTA